MEYLGKFGFSCFGLANGAPALSRVVKPESDAHTRECRTKGNGPFCRERKGIDSHGPKWGASV